MHPYWVRLSRTIPAITSTNEAITSATTTPTDGPFDPYYSEGHLTSLTVLETLLQVQSSPLSPHTRHLSSSNDHLHQSPTLPTLTPSPLPSGLLHSLWHLLPHNCHRSIRRGHRQCGPRYAIPCLRHALLACYAASVDALAIATRVSFAPCVRTDLVEYRQGLDDLNRFVNHFKLPLHTAMVCCPLPCPILRPLDWSILI